MRCSKRFHCSTYVVVQYNGSGVALGEGIFDPSFLPRKFIARPRLKVEVVVGDAALLDLSFSPVSSLHMALREKEREEGEKRERKERKERERVRE